jgi:hypothetical protein
VIKENQLYTNFGECDFFQKEIKYIGHVILAEGVEVDLEKIKEIMDWFAPRNVIEVRSFM